MMQVFSESVKDALKYYVYALVSPRDNKIFYIGKGKNDRVFHHSNAAINSADENLKLNVIRDILKKGLSVKYFIIRHNLSEQEALLVESSIIDLLTYPQFNTERVLTNIAKGYHQWDEGIKTCEELKALYDCGPIQDFGEDGILLVSLKKSFDQVKAYGVYRRVDIYDVTRRYWAIGKSKPSSIKYVLGVYKGVVRSVLKVEAFHWVNIADDGTVFRKPRCCFEGKLIDDSRFINKNVSAYPFGSGGAVRYI